MGVRLFGTDGVRGVANDTLTPECAFALGQAAARVLLEGTRSPQVLVGRDSRWSADLLESALSAGLMAVGVTVVHAGILPTPAVAYLTRRLGMAAGVMISASHNPIADNGIKFFGSDGFKLPDAVEDAIEAVMDRPLEKRPTGLHVGRVHPLPRGAVRDYLEHLAEAAGPRPVALNVVVDAAHGAATRVAAPLMRRVGATARVIHATPDGRRINVGCGSTHPAALQRRVRAAGADLGLALDGDADRLIAVDERGEIVDGDALLLILARALRHEGRLAGDAVVATVMSNLGLKQALARDGIRLVESPVGDRYVLESMLRSGAVLGGEQSGHILQLDRSTAGDGLLTGMRLLSVLASTGLPLSSLAADLRRLPQVLRNVRVERTAGYETLPGVAEAVASGREALGESGRILVRASGTEPLIRVMAEGEPRERVEAVVLAVAHGIARALHGEVM